MRHLINTYIQADPADLLGTSSLSLTEADHRDRHPRRDCEAAQRKGEAVAGRGIAEGIINNVRKTIVREQLTDPRFYEEMSEAAGGLDRAKARRDRRLRTVPDQRRGLGEEAGPGQERERSAGPVALATRRRPCSTTTCRASWRRRCRRNMVAGPPPSTATSADPRPEAGQGDARGTRPLEGRPGEGGHVQNAIFPIVGRTKEATLAVFEIIKHQLGY